MSEQRVSIVQVNGWATKRLYDVRVGEVVIHRNVGPRQALQYRDALEEVLGEAYARGYFKGSELERQRR